MTDAELLNLDPTYGLPTFYDGTFYEMGDTAHNTFTLLYCGWDGIWDYTALKLLTSPDGWPRRAPPSPWWYSRPGRSSRDLLTPYLVYLASQSSKQKPFRALLRTMASKAFLRANNVKPNFRYDSIAEHALLATPDVPFEPQTQAADWLGPDIWAVCLRGLMVQNKACAVLWPTLLFLDLHGLGAALLQLYNPKTDLRNQALKTHFSATHWPTPISKLSMAIFKRSKPTESFKTHWTQPGEPRIDLWLSRLFV